MQIDVAYLQETHLLPPEAEKLGTIGWKVLVSAPYSSKARGMIILIRNTHDVTTHSTIIDPQGRHAIADITFDRSQLTLCNLYAPYFYSKYLFWHVLAKLYQLGDRALILGGDFSVVSSPRIDRSSSRRSGVRTPSVSIPHITKHLRLMDIWRVLHPLEKDYTCLSAAHGSLSRIDYLRTSESLFPQILESHIELICISDHTLCWVRVAHSIERGPHKQWRFPSHLTQSIKFREAVLAAWMPYAADNLELPIPN